MDNNGTHPTRLKKTIAWVLLFLYLGQPLAAQAAQAAKHSSQRPVSKLTRPPRAPRPETSQYPITPTGKNPSIDYAANGVRVIYINKPTGSGISHNQYQDFNVGPTGLILDNAYNITLTELGGYIQGNPNLANGSARIILNEVTGPHLSRLNGYTEIAGKQAELIIANPNGITGDGFGFINTSRATLTTGSPVFDPGGSLGGFQVTDGQIAIQGDGLNAANIDRVDLISRTTQINAGIWANQLNIVTGANDVSYQTLDAKKLDIAASEPPAVSLDVGQLGGMYANKILLIGTEQGVGVHSQGTVMADSDLTITQDGKLILAGSTQAQGNITIHSQDLTQEGNLYAQGNTQITTAGAITNSGILAAGNNASLNAQTIQSSQLLAAGLNADGALGAHGNLSLISRDQAQLSGQQSAAQNITIQAGAIDLTQASTSAGQQITLTAANGSILHQEASLTAGGKATLTATGTIDNTQGAIQTGQGLTLTAAAINNTQGSLLNLDASPLTLDASQTLTNTQGLIGTNGAVTIHAKTLVNRNQGQIIAGETLSLITTGAIDNTQGQINAIGLLDLTAANITNSGGQLAANTDATLTTGSFTQDGTIIAGRDLALSLSQNYTHQAGTQLLAGRNLSLTTTGTLTNSGTLEAVDTLTVSGKNITNQTNASLAAGNTINLQAATGAITNQGRIDSTSVNTQSQTLTNTGGIVGNLITLQADILTNTGSSAIIAATHGVTLLGKTKIQNKSGATLYSQGDIFIAASDQPKPDGSYERTGAFLNDSTSRIEAHRNLSILAETLSNDGLISGEQIYIEGKTIQNNAGKPVTGSQTGDPSQDTPALPGNGLYTVRPEATSQYLVETDPRFTSYEAFTTSDYMLEQLGLDPEATLKRLGDGHYEQKLVRDQITQLTGRRLSDGYESDDQAYKALLENGAQTAKEMNLTVGVALTDDQVKNLSHDMVWMVEKEVQGQKVLVPVVYLANTANKETTSAGGLITGKNVVLKAEGDITNSGAIRASHYTGLEAKNIVNRAGAITGGTTHLKTSEDIRNQSGKISGANVLLDAGRDIKNETLITTTTSSTTKTLPKKHWFSRKTKETTTTTTTTAGPTGSIEASENLTAVAGRDITIAGASLTAGQDLALQAGRNLAVNTVETKDTKTITGKGYSSSQETTTHLQSNIQAGGNATLAAQNDLTLQGANLTAGQDLALQAGRNLAVNAAQQKQSSAENKKKYSHHSQTITNLQSNIQAGGNATLVAQNDLTLRGANLAAQNDLTLAAGGNITVAAVKDRVTEDTKKGSRKNYTYTKTDDESVVGSQLAAGGNITIAAVQLDDPNPNTSANRGNVTIEGSAVQTGQGNIAIAADNNIDIKAASERHETYTETKKTKKRTFSSKTTVKTKRTVENNAIGSIIQAGAASNGNTEDTEPKPTLQITSGKDLTIQGSMVAASGAVQLNAANDVQITSAQDTLTIDTTYSSKKRGALSSKVKIDNQHTAITTASGSLVSGDTVAINAGRDLTVSGSSVAGTGDVALSAKNNLNILSAQDTMTNQRYTYEKTSGLTASFQGGFSLSAGTTSLKTTTDETSVSQVESIVGSQNGTLTLLAGQDATISGSDILGGAGIDLLAQNITI
ncbi:hemagglutinin repeat-containing protein, partial [Acetonema longum]